MTALLDEARRFLELAAHDLAAFRALADLPHIRQAVAFFHAQQSVEKSLKAVYFVRGMEFRRTHDLLELAGRLEPRKLSWTRPSVRLAGCLARRDDDAGAAPARRSNTARRPASRAIGRVAISPNG
jgi:HEPN domain-containing protein